MDQLVWAPHLHDGYRLATVEDVGATKITAKFQADGASVTAPYDRVFPADDPDKGDVADNCGLMYLNEASLLHNLRKRYNKDAIYTYTANILIAVNPYKSLPIYGPDYLTKYRGQSLGVLPPHVYALADQCYRNMKTSRMSQSIVVSGESGSGKTESCKFIVRYLTDTGKGTGDIEQRIVEANPLLESFGNAKTTRNHNSSRFGKFIEIHFDDKHHIAGAYISHYLLEKSRICSPGADERNYHAFYRLCAGAPADVKKALNLGGPETFRYLKGGTLSAVPGLDDARDFEEMSAAMDHVGMSVEEKQNIYRILAAVLHLGNIEFEEDASDKKGGSTVTGASQATLQGSSAMLGLPDGELKVRLTSRMMSTTRGGAMGTVYRVPLSLSQARAACDALAKALYSNLFDWIVARVNKCFPFSASSAYVGVLDIAGFEYFQHNSFEQFCINYCNEKLQQFFNDKVLKQEQELYKSEKIQFKEIEFVDNQDCIDLVEEKGSGIFALLDEEAKMPQANDERFTTAVHTKHGKHFRFASTKKAKLNIHKKLNDTEGFVIRHFAGGVCYETKGFLEKNTDALHADLEALMDESEDPFVQTLFTPPKDTTAPAAKKGSVSKAGGSRKLALASVGNKFKNQLSTLMTKLNDTQASFIRCVKPNLTFEAGVFSGAEILSQLQCAGMVQVLELLQGGYPSRTSFADLYNAYKDKLDPALAQLGPKVFCEALFMALQMDARDFQFGTTRVFFSAGKFAEFDQITVSDPEMIKSLVSKVKNFLTRKRWKRAMYAVLALIKLGAKIKYRAAARLIVQKSIRGHVTRRKWVPRIEQARTERIQRELAEARAKEEAERVKRLEEEAERERVKRLEEERKRKEAEEERRRHAEMEVRRKKEEEEHRVREAAEQKRREAEAAQIAEADKKRAAEEARRVAMEEQDKRDTELAQRLTQDEATPQVVEEEQEAPAARPAAGGAAAGKHDLSGWKYSELRETIAISADVELVEACREEFHRRLKVYHAWKQKNQKKRGGRSKRESAAAAAADGEASRMPAQIDTEARKADGADGAGGLAPPTPPTRSSSRAEHREQRYFKIPFKVPSEKGDGKYKNKGSWLAHFDGQWIARQLEVHSEKKPIVLVSGKNDTEMCELSLEETGLTRKHGVEITEKQFEADWQKAGGPVYNKRASAAR